MDEIMEFMDSLKLYFEPPDNGTEFKPFSRLPIELRLKIWRSTWTPKEIWVKKALFKCFDEEFKHPYPLPDANLPVTAWVNQESRKETLRLYRTIPDSEYYTFDSYFNAKMDSLKLDVCARSLFRSFDPVHLLGVQRLTISAGLYYFDWAHHFKEGWDAFWFNTPYVDHVQPEYQTIGALLHYVKPRHLSSLVHLKFDGNRALQTNEFREDMRNSIRPLFFRYRGGKGGIQIVPIAYRERTIERLHTGKSHTKKWFKKVCGAADPIILTGFEIFFLGPREAACIQDKAEPAANHRVWLDFVSIYLWHALKPERLLDADGVASFRTDPQASYLL
ncbi:hypothetical protein PG991_013371 [Apiospora marii]|uniref:2EXR domain-containing protein n=1 Tax=Apiospora marii TaxID=335849 RepID=A0ABR1R5T9_9PEZI